MQKHRNLLSREAYRLRNIRDHPIHTEYCTAANLYKEAIDTTRDEHWGDWLEEVSAQEIQYTSPINTFPATPTTTPKPEFPHYAPRSTEQTPW